ncbi:MAG: methyl-accepting chemotaxis protein [Rhodocyclaceae bacterium]|nr:methyl-accepting chemotaxis protein [Rhodocyclaceae bacterium]
MNLRDFTIGTRLMATTFGALALMVTFVVIALFSLNRIGGAADRIVDFNNRKIDLSVEVRMRNLLVGRHMRTALLRDSKSQIEEEHAKVRADMDKATKAEEELLPLVTSEEGRKQLALEVDLRRASDASMEKVVGLLLQDKKEEGKKLFFDETRPRLQEWFDAVGDVVQRQKVHNRTEITAIKELQDNTRILLLGLIALAVLIMIPAGTYVVRLITRPMARAVEVADAVAADKLDNHIEVEGKDEVAALMRALKIMQENLLERTAAERRVAQENRRIRVGLDNVATNVMIADRDGQVIYLNRAIQAMLRDAESDLRKDLPDFRADAVLGASMERLHRDPAHQKGFLEGLRGTHRATVAMGGRTFNLTFAPVVDESGARLGTAAEWQDRSAEIAVEGEVAAMVDAAARGDFSRRLELAGKDGFYLRVSQGLNKLTEEVSRGLEDVGRVLNAVAQGALTERVQGQYEGIFGQLANDTNTTVSRLHEVLGNIREATEAINAAAREIAEGNSDLSARTEEQASSLEETASSMEQINATVKQNAENARQAKSLAANSHEVVVRSGQMVNEVVETMGGIAASSRKMSDIIGVIDSIAFQTNILALNAAVEAARAGEQGRGFAVVATEVRALAQRSATAAKEIKTLIADSVGRVEGGVRLVQEAGDTMGQVVSSFQKVAALVTEIASASSEQSSGVEQVTLAVGQMDEVTQQNAALVEEAAAAAESLEDQARNLSQSVAVFRLAAADGGVRTASAPRTARLPEKKALPARSALPGPSGSSGHARPALAKSPRGSGASPARTEEEWGEF